MSLRNNKGGWIVWIWGKMGSLMIMLSLVTILLTLFTHTNVSLQIASANDLARAIRDDLYDAYSSVGGIEYDLRLPKTLHAREYGIEFEKVGKALTQITVRSTTSPIDVVGVAHVDLPIDDDSYSRFSVSDSARDLCIIKHSGLLHIQRSKCQ